MADMKIDPKKQFSKKLARWTAVFWFVYMGWLSTIVYLSPAAALYCVYMSIIVTVVMIVNVWAYTKNSIYEKACFALLDKMKLELAMKGTAVTEMTGAIKDAVRGVKTSTTADDADGSAEEGENNG